MVELIADRVCDQRVEVGDERERKKERLTALWTQIGQTGRRQSRELLLVP